MISATLQTNFVKVLSDLKLYNESHDVLEVESDDNLIEVTHKNGKIFTFYLDPITQGGSKVSQLTYIDDEGKKFLGFVHDENDEKDIRSGIKKVFM